MPAFTLRMESRLARELDRFCKENGYKKNGLVTSLIRRFLAGKGERSLGGRTKKGIRSLVGIVRLGGDAAQEENYFE